jgi:hypothetical protein
MDTPKQNCLTSCPICLNTASYCEDPWFKSVPRKLLSSVSFRFSQFIQIKASTAPDITTRSLADEGSPNQALRSVSSLSLRKHEIRKPKNFSLYRQTFNPLSAELNPICYLLTLLAHHFHHVSRISVKTLTFWLLMSYIYIYIYIDIYMERIFLMFLDQTQRRSTVGKTPLVE